MKLLITGAAGFIGYHTVCKFCDLGYKVIGIDNINDYYDTELKYNRLKACGIEKNKIKNIKSVKSVKFNNYVFLNLNIVNGVEIDNLFETEKFDQVIHLAAQAGVRYSLDNPKTYIQSNIVGFINILEACKVNNVKKIIYASSSSIYGMSKKQPLSISDSVDNPISLYAATKKSNELMAHVYSHLFGITTIGLRFFTVYGPWGRPDMAPFLFTNAIIKREKIKIFNYGDITRDFTFIDDIIDGIEKVSNINFKSNYQIFNIGNRNPVRVLYFVELLEKELGVKVEKELCGMQPGDVKATWADIKELTDIANYKPKINLEDGVKKFIKWYKSYYSI